MTQTLAERQLQYEACYDYQIIRKLPLIIKIEGINFARLTKNLSKPYDPLFLKCMVEAMHFAIMEVNGAVFGYQQGNEISYILRNDFELDEEPWHNNRLQDIISTVVSRTTLGFHKALQNLDDKLNLVGDAIFKGKVFALPHVGEAANYLVWRQQDCLRHSVSAAAKAEIGKKLSKHEAFTLLDSKSTLDKKRLLFEHADIDFDEFYPAAFRHGVGIYKIPMVIELSSKESVTRNKWTLNWDLPAFLEEKDFVLNVLINGTDIFRAK